MTSVKEAMFSTLIPNCPAASPIEKRLFAVIGIRKDMSWNSFLSLLRTGGAALIVLIIPVKAVSESIAALTA